MKKSALIILIFVLTPKMVLAIEVGGHLTEDTIWSPENNPYQVVNNIFVDEGVTLTILPGTVVRIRASEFIQDNQLEAFVFREDNPDVCMFYVDGQIIAEGTDDDPILFTRFPDEIYHYWGIFYVSEQAELSIFKHCRIEHSLSMRIGMTRYQGAVNLRNGQAIIESCHFVDNAGGLTTRNNLDVNQDFLIKHNRFETVEGFHENVWGVNSFAIGSSLRNNETALIVGNQFIEKNGISSSSSLFAAYNRFQSASGILDIDMNLLWINQHSYLYRNTFSNTENGIFILGDLEDENAIYIKKNEMYGAPAFYGVWINHVYTEIIGNVFDNCPVYASDNPNSIIQGNRIMNENGHLAANVSSIENNIIYNCDIGLSGLGRDRYGNNVFANNAYIFSSINGNRVIQNNVLIGNEFLHYYPYNYGNPTFRNCILDFELPEGCIDGGGNIWADSLAIDDLFADWQNGDFHLAPNSLAIDAGFDTTAVYYPYLDLDDNLRIWDGDNDDSAIIDIGPYEYGAPASGGIHGTIFQTEGGDPVDYVLLKIDNQPGEFEFADSSGYYEFRLPPGVYDIYASRVFYDNVVVEDIEVIEGEMTDIDFWMESTLSIEDDTPRPVDVSDVILHQNFPNPFNPTTTIAYTVETHGHVSLRIYNTSGQLVHTLIDRNEKPGEKSVQWDGRNNHGEQVASGLYFYRLETEDYQQTRRMLLLK